MAAYIPVPDAMELEVRFIIEGQRIENVFTFSTGGESFVAAAQLAYDALNTAWWPTMRGFFSTGVSHDSVHATDLSAQDGPVADFGQFDNPLGTVNTGSAPLNVAACVTLSTLKRGRSFRGRKYMGPPALGNIAGSFVNGAAVTVVNDAFDALLAAAATAGVPLIVVSKYSNKAPRVTGIQTLVSTARLQDSTLDSQRRRLPGRGQ